MAAQPSNYAQVREVWADHAAELAASDRRAQAMEVVLDEITEALEQPWYAALPAIHAALAKRPKT